MVRITTLIAVLLLASTASARIVPFWSYEQLLKESELVLIVKVLSNRDATKEDTVLPPSDPFDRRTQTAVVTKMRVLAVLKGKYENEEFELNHFRMDDKKLRAEGIETIGNGPSFVNFETGRKKVQGKGWSANTGIEYMIFLKKNRIGQYVCVTGQTDPEYSVRQIHLPLPVDQ